MKLYDKVESVHRCKALAHSFERLLGRPLLEKRADTFWPVDLTRVIYEAPFALVAHDNLPDPVFRFANAKALELWNMGDEELIGMPSRLSAEPAEQEERERLLARVAKDGFCDDYHGIRIAKGGQRFRIEKVIVWNVTDEAGDYIGQAAKFDHWTLLPPVPDTKLTL